MKIPATVVTRAVLLRCDVCGETRFVHAQISSKPSEDQTCPDHIQMDIEVEIDPRDYDTAERFGRIHLSPRALVCGR